MKAYKTGLVLTILSWLACLNPYWIIFAGPGFIIGLLIVWFSKTKIRTKLLTTFLPLLLWYPGMLSFFFLASKHMTPETFLVPKDFRGKITLIYNEPCGQTIPIVDGRLIYKIPDNGVMILTNEFETGIIDQEYYFVDDKWNKIGKIPPLIQQDFNEDYTLEKNENEPPRNKVGVFLLGSGGGSTSKNDDYNYHMMAINSWDSLRVQSNGGFIDNFVDSLLFQCRQKNKNYR
jgi:energy-coupling factor transporter transmembrane protein EcfT